ncbi:hypothetical protein EVAR_97864_1 [Eumeta japonica]|uniref:Uncharacterized protein n=1 Tax=Eumeta variegata TaxID=151549 RepID=A0A4C1WVV9_EUMVA|nr:hypothetical protein EVAR_97864_1 [Eumeta japonica]
MDHPQATIYCLVASHKKKYTSLCAAQSEAEKNKDNRKDDSSDILDINPQNGEKPDDDNVIPKARLFDLYEGKFINHIRRKKFIQEVVTTLVTTGSLTTPNSQPVLRVIGNLTCRQQLNNISIKAGRSTKATDEDPVVACVGGRSHHLIENLDLTKSYYVTLFGVGDDRRAGSLLAWAELRPRTSIAKRLKQNQHYIIDLKGRTIFYYKAASNSGGLWLAVSTCGGAADLEVSVRGKRLRVQKNIEPYAKIFVPAPSVSSSIQETSDEDSVQVDSGSEESRVRYVIKLYPSWRDESDSSIRLELLVSPSQWGANTPELAPEDGASVREIRPYRSCKSLQIAFLPATHQTADTMRYCVIARESPSGDSSTTCSSGKRTSRTTCITQALPTKYICLKQFPKSTLL